MTSTLGQNHLDVPKREMPATIITGFLGSGKTTLLNHILQNCQDLKVAVLVNEFGEINIDSQLLVSVEEDMVELSNGCICCAINDSLLVVGAGTGFEIAKYGKAKSNWQILGVDPSRKMLAIAQDKISQSELSERVQLIQGYTQELPVASIYDGTTCILVMHFLPDDGSKLSLLQSIAQRLKSSANEPLLLEIKAVERFQTVMDDDLNSPGGLSVLFELAKELRRQGNLFLHQGKTDIPSQRIKKQWHTLVHLAPVLGLEAIPTDETAAFSNGLSEAEIEALIQKRQDARKARNFAESDRIRNQLQALGITLID